MKTFTGRRGRARNKLQIQRGSSNPIVFEVPDVSFPPTVHKSFKVPEVSITTKKKGHEMKKVLDLMKKQESLQAVEKEHLKAHHKFTLLNHYKEHRKKLHTKHHKGVSGSLPNHVHL
ncbi:hypothetical protein Bca4012_031162 [Brassica carinata]